MISEKIYLQTVASLWYPVRQNSKNNALKRVKISLKRRFNAIPPLIRRFNALKYVSDITLTWCNALKRIKFSLKRHIYDGYR